MIVLLRGRARWACLAAGAGIAAGLAVVGPSASASADGAPDTPGTVAAAAPAAVSAARRMAAPEWPRTLDTPVSRAQIEALIDRFTAISNAPSEEIPPFTPPDLPLPEPRTFRQFVLAVYADIPAIRDVEALGVQALPALLDHLQDARRTKVPLPVPRYMIGALVNLFPFDARPWDRVPHPKPDRTFMTGPGANAGGGDPLTVGAACYIAIGHIVDRQYLDDQPVPSAQLAAIVRAEWEGLTPAEHLRSLLADVHADGGGVHQLCYYYPEAARQDIITELDRPLCDRYVTTAFIGKQLIERPWFTADDILDPPAIAAALAAGSDKDPRADVLTYLAQQSTRPDNPPTAGLSGDDLAAAVAYRLDNLLLKRKLYNRHKFESIALRPDTRRRLDADSGSILDGVFANRMLIEDVFAGQIRRCPAPLETDPAVWRQRLDAFVALHGAAYRDYVYKLLRPEFFTYNARPLAERQEDRAMQIRAALFPERPDANPTLVNASDLGEQATLLADIKPFHSPDVDAAVDRLLVQVTSRVAAIRNGIPDSESEENEFERCGSACVDFLSGRGYLDDRRMLCQACIAYDTSLQSTTDAHSDEYQGTAADLVRLREEVERMR